MHFKMPQYFGGSNVLEWRVAAYVKDGFTDEWKHCGSSADVVLHARRTVHDLIGVQQDWMHDGRTCNGHFMLKADGMCEGFGDSSSWNKWSIKGEHEIEATFRIVKHRITYSRDFTHGVVTSPARSPQSRVRVQNSKFTNVSGKTALDRVNTVLKVTPLPEWQGQECMFQILMRNEYGWNASSSNFSQMASNTQTLSVPSNSDVVRLSEKDSERLHRGLVGNMFSANPESVMVLLALTPKCRPFAFTTKTLVQYAVDNQLRSAQHLVGMPEQGNTNVYL